MKIVSLDEKEMRLVRGGSITSSVINAVNTLVDFIYKLGYQLGSGIRRIVEGCNCPLN